MSGSVGFEAIATVLPSFLADSIVPTPGRFLGRLHPLVVHFPIALAAVAAGVELVRAFRRERGLSAATPLLLAIAAAGGIAAAVSGWFNAANERGSDAGEVFAHRWLGTIAAALLVGLAWRAFAVARRPAAATIGWGGIRAELVVLAAFIGFAAHLGGNLVHGDGYLQKGLYRVERVERSAEASAPAAGGGLTPVGLSDNARLFVEEVAPLFAARCEECHGPARRKGGLQLLPIETAFRGDPEDWTILAGDADASLVVRRVELSRDHPDAMPPEGKGLTSEEVATIRRWIAGGAEYPREDAAAPAPAVGAAPEAPIGDRAALELARGEIRERGGLVQAQFAGSPLEEVNASLASPPWTDADLVRLDGLAEALVSLNLARSAVGDEGVARLPAFPRLTHLRLDGSRVGDAAARAIAGWPSLEVVNLVGTAVGDEGLLALAAHPKLRRIYVWQSRVTPEGRDRALALRGDLEIVGLDEPTASPAASPPASPQASEAETEAGPDA